LFYQLHDIKVINDVRIEKNSNVVESIKMYVNRNNFSNKYE